MAHCRPLLTPDQLRHLSTPALDGAHQLGEDALAVLEGRLCGELRGDKSENRICIALKKQEFDALRRRAQTFRTQSKQNVL